MELIFSKHSRRRIKYCDVHTDCEVRHEELLGLAQGGDSGREFKVRLRVGWSQRPAAFRKTGMDSEGAETNSAQRPPLRPRSRHEPPSVQK